jgi:hypothetical protein
MLVRESISFQRGADPKSILGIGNDFNTLSPGAILRTKRFFGVSKSTGTIGGYNSSSIKFKKDSYLLVIRISYDAYNKKSFHWIKFFELEDAEIKRELLKNEGIQKVMSDTWWGYKRGFFSMLSKVRFDYRFEIIEKGF